MRRIELSDNMFQGHVSLERRDEGVRPWRLPFDKLLLFPPDDGIKVRAGMTAGVRLRFSSDSKAFAMTVVSDSEVERKYDLTCDGELLSTYDLAQGQSRIEFCNLGGNECVYELWLPQTAPNVIVSLEIDDDASFSVPKDSRLKWVTYGSSITHCGSAHSPSRTWPATVARINNFNLTCLGYGGQCHCDSMVGRMIRDMPADFISLKLGINVYGGSSLNPRSFKPAIIGIVQIIREKHPEIPIALISPIICPDRENEKNLASFTLVEMREELLDAVGRMKSCGDTNLHYFNGLDIFGEDLVGDYLPDNLHPNGEGYEHMGRNFSRVVVESLGLS